MPEQNHEERRTRPIADFLAEHNKGANARKASEALQEVVAAAVDTGKKGSVTIVVNVEPMKNADAGTIMTTVVVTSKVPVDAPRGAVFYADEDHNLTRSDPKQPTFEGLKDVGGPTVKDAPAGPTVRSLGGER